MNKEQQEYLRKALAGTIRAVKPIVKDSINAIAMDTVKGTVLENGEVFDDYIGGVGKALGFGEDLDP